jgi:NAD/NADP transhydrogenase beta subunit
VPHNPRVYSYLITGLVVAAVLIIRLQRMRRVQRLRLEALWVVPVLLAAVAAVILVSTPPAAGDWPWLVLGVVIGGGLGYVRGRMMAISVEPATGLLNVQASPLALASLLALMVARIALRATLTGLSSSLHISLAAVTDSFILLAVALVVVQRLEMGLRAARLLADARRGPTG